MEEVIRRIEEEIKANRERIRVAMIVENYRDNDLIALNRGLQRAIEIINEEEK